MLSLMNTNPKMGKDDAVIVATFKVFRKQPAYDLENFIEKGYDWVIDAETSAGEISEGLLHSVCRSRTS